MMFSSQPSGPRRGLTGTHVLMSLVGFFAVIVVADATLIYKALTTFGGVDNVNAYRDGLAYNQRIESDTRQSALGWEEGVELGGDPLRLRVSLKDREGRPSPARSSSPKWDARRRTGSTASSTSSRSIPAYTKPCSKPQGRVPGSPTCRPFPAMTPRSRTFRFGGGCGSRLRYSPSRAERA